jgi:hypothetical protein
MSIIPTLSLIGVPHSLVKGDQIPRNERANDRSSLRKWGDSNANADTASLMHVLREITGASGEQWGVVILCWRRARFVNKTDQRTLAGIAVSGRYTVGELTELLHAIVTPYTALQHVRHQEVAAPTPILRKSQVSTPSL